ncbi:MAG TPA: hypothetical protein V6C57_16770 [Coleofasciculaceae cyanobacterium]
MDSIPLLDDVEEDIIFTNAYFNSETLRPAVYWQLNGRNGLLSLTEARARAQTLFQAVGYAEGEAAIVLGLTRLHKAADQSSKGFGAAAKAKAAAAERQTQEMMGMLLHVVRQGRSPLLEGVEVIFGFETQQARINVSWYEDGEPDQWSTIQALDHAILLIQTAEASESDAFFRNYLIEAIGIEPDRTAILIEEFQLFRHRRQLDDLFFE